MSRLCCYAGGLACLVTVLALVGCGGGPGSQPEPKEIGNIAFQQGEKVRTIPLSDKFTGADLTYSATTSNRSVATATVDNDADTLTVTAVGAGTAKITVTAKNSQGEAKQTFTVTPASDPVEIQDFTFGQEQTTHTIPLGDKFSGANLTYTAASNNERVATATVNNDADTLTVTAVGTGTATITVTATAQGSAPQTKTFTVTVPQPADEEAAPTVRTGARPSVSVAQGDTETVTLSTVFDGANLSYEVESSADTVATASESGGTLTITGVSIGPAIITIVATNTAGSSPAHAIAVTVTAPATTPPETPTTSSGTLTIKRGESAKRTLPAGQTLQPPSSGGVKVERSPDGETGNVWLITATKKGTWTIIINSAKPERVGSIVVVVPNSPPVRKHDMKHPPILVVPTRTSDMDPYTTVDLNLETFFTDADAANDDALAGMLEYSIGSNPDGVLIDAEGGFLRIIGSLDRTGETITGSPVGGLKLEVLEEVRVGFAISIYAHDDTGDRSTRPVIIKFPKPADPADRLMPRKRIYNSEQDSNGALNKRGTLKVGPRIGAEHTLNFIHDDSGFLFANKAFQGLKDSKRLISSNVIAVGIYYKNANGTILDSSDAAPSTPLIHTVDTLPAETSLGANYFLLESTGVVELTGVALGNNPRVDFKLNKRGTGSITVKHYVVRAKTAITDPTSPPSAVADFTLGTPFSKPLAVSTVTCSSPPDPITPDPIKCH